VTLVTDPVAPPEAPEPPPATERRRFFGEPGSNRRWWFWVLLITLGGLAVRIAYILLCRDHFIYGKLPSGEPLVTRVWGDGYVYHQQANLFVDGKGIIAPLPYSIRHVVQQAADHPPLYIFYLAIFSLVGLRGDLTHMLLSAPMGAMTAVAFALLARRIWSPRAGVIAAVIGAFNPSIIHFPGFILSETLSLPLIAATAIWLYRFWDRPTWWNAAGAGGFCGLAVLCHPDAAMIVPLAIVPFVVLVKRVDLRRRALALVAAGIACGAFVLPWVGYNLHRYEKPVYLSVGLDYSMAQGSCDQTYSGDLIGYYWLACMGERLEGTGLELKDQSLGAAHLHEVTMAYIRDHLAQTPLVVAARVGRVTGVFRPLQQADLETVTEGREHWLSNLSVVSYYPLAILAAVGLTQLRRRRRPVLPLVAMIASSLIGCALTLAVLRYRAGAEPAIAVLAAVAVDNLIGWVQRSWRDTGDPVEAAAP
jgi:4-amino-4-deoxy-L-arabinose transferase-like glycosyltransferase